MTALFETPIRPEPAGDREAVRFGHAARFSKDAATVVAWGDCDAAMAWRLRDCLDAVAGEGHRRIGFDVGEMRFVEFTAVAVLAGALIRASQGGIDVALQPAASRSAQILHAAHLRALRTTRVERGTR